MTSILRKNGSRIVSTPKKSTANSTGIYLSILGISGILVSIWYQSFFHGVFVQDDPSMLKQFGNANVSNVEKIFGGEHLANRWRPVANFGYWLGFLIFRNHYWEWVSLNGLLLSLLVGAVGVGIYQLTSSLSFSIGIVIVLATSRFFFGQMLNATFLVEAIANLLLVAILWQCLKYEHDGQVHHVYSALLLNFLLVLDHERFVTIGIPIALWLFFKNSGATKYFYMFLAITPTILLFAIKYFWFHIPIFVGTGSAWQVGFKIKTAAIYFCELVLGVFGLNVGPSQLNGLVWNQQSTFVRTASSLLVLLILTSIVLLSTKMITKFKKVFISSFKLVLIWLVLFAALAIPVVSTIRIEQRWYIGAFLELLVLLAIGSRKSWKSIKGPERKTLDTSMRYRRIRAIFGCILALSLFLNIQYRGSINEIYFAADQLSFSQTLKTLESAHIESEHTKFPIFISTPGDATQYKDWLILFASANGFKDTQGITFVNSGQKVPTFAIHLDNSTGILARV